MTAGDYCPRCRGIHDILKDCVVPAPVDYGHWSTAQLALKAMTKERDALLLQVGAITEKYHQSTANVADLIGKLEQSNRLNEELKKFALEKTREMHNVWGHPGDFMSCVHGACPKNVKAMAGFVERPKGPPWLACGCLIVQTQNGQMGDHRDGCTEKRIDSPQNPPPCECDCECHALAAMFDVRCQNPKCRNKICQKESR